MRLLITRPAEDARPLARHLEARGHSVIVEPLLTIAPLTFSLPEGPIAAILLTSRHAARQLAGHAETLNQASVPICCVGQATAEAARAAGLALVNEADGDAVALVEKARHDLDPSAGVLVHLRSRHTRGQVANQLRSNGFEVRELIAYDATLAKHLPPPVRKALAAYEIDGVLLFSPRTARVFADLVSAEGLACEIAGTTAWCLSEAVAEALAPMAMQVRIAPRPNLQSLLELIDKSPPAKP